MNKKVSLLVVLIMLLLTLQGFGLEIPGYEGGIKNEMTYMEVIFITGEPIIMEGTLDIRITERNQRGTERYSYRLENTDKDAKLTRTVNLSTNIVEKDGQRQEVYSVTSYKETIEVAGVKYDTDQKSSQWSKSNISEMKPGVTYFAGNWDGRKIYTVNNNGGKVTVETRGDVVGYHQYWGTTENQTIEHFIRFEGTGDDAVKWQGTARVEAVHNRTRDYSYESNAPTQISFRGGFLMTQQEENVLKVSYDLPRLGDDGSLKSQRNVGVNSYSIDTNPINERLTIPSMRDVSGHGAESDILLLASLGAVPSNTTNFGPSLPISRGDFARFITVAMGIPVEEEETRSRSVQSKDTKALFVDVNNSDPNFKYIKAITDNGVMHGTGEGRFYPNRSVTKAEIAAILVRLLGFESLAPIQSYSTGYKDDSQIPTWAKDAVYITSQLELIDGTSDNYFQPNRDITKAEVATILTNLIHYLQKELRYDYRESIINF
ncbi:S-layer homology domain-containing protein [Alkaliphilus peptidifermentans]|uniref:S-layer homology domain-containing protein n=1 Tax=Alkaliphilus peptidifermentans DSM 18978 TaxID=1120976 RepID=A0A1G5AIW8_9FIRM|nr:S-layer homology domain-containing protein [Alkaliphilus peptidifermentans]SCX77826.1 S-layer homology domain-containing protein [Alkaliphilus peptidifermentans DSM 18978]